MPLDRKCNEDSKNVLKNMIQSFKVGFAGNFVPEYHFKHSNCVFLAIQTLTPFYSLTVPDFVLFFMPLDRKFNEDSKNVLKNVIQLLQVGFTGDFVLDYHFKLCFWQFKL